MLSPSLNMGQACTPSPAASSASSSSSRRDAASASPPSRRAIAPIDTSSPDGAALARMEGEGGRTPAIDDWAEADQYTRIMQRHAAAKGKRRRTSSEGSNSATKIKAMPGGGAATTTAGGAKKQLTVQIDGVKRNSAGHRAHNSSLRNAAIILSLGAHSHHPSSELIRAALCLSSLCCWCCSGSVVRKGEWLPAAIFIFLSHVLVALYSASYLVVRLTSRSQTQAGLWNVSGTMIGLTLLSAWLNLLGITVRLSSPRARVSSSCRHHTALVLILLADFALLVGLLQAGYHRLWSHNSYRATYGLRVFLAIIGLMSFQGSARWWVLKHRLHHRFTDTEQDPYDATKVSTTRCKRES